MIKGTSLQVTKQDIEQMFINGLVKPTDESRISVIVDYDSLSDSEKIDYDAAISVVSASYDNSIINTEADLQIDRVTSKTLNSAQQELDWNSMSEEDKDKLRALLTIIVSKSLQQA